VGQLDPDAPAACRLVPFPVQGLGFRAQGSWFRVQGSGFRVQGSGFRVQGSGFRVQGSGFRVQGSGFCTWLDSGTPRHPRRAGLSPSQFRASGLGFKV
jgi:hypothetical protein